MSETEIKRTGIQKQKSKDHLHVNFLNSTSKSEQNDEKKKYLTAKFEAKEIILIRKRLEVENWMLEKLRELCKNDEECDAIEIDLDQVLEIETDLERTNYLLDKLATIEKVQNEIDQFVTCLLEKLKSLVNC